MSDDNDQWWFCLKHKNVEHGDSCANAERMGPYASREEAEGSLAQAAERTEQWDNDPKWRED